MCADQWDKQDADVACRMMDFDGALSADFEYEEETEIKGRPWLSNMNCTRNAFVRLAFMEDSDFETVKRREKQVLLANQEVILTYIQYSIADRHC